MQTNPHAIATSAIPRWKRTKQLADHHPNGMVRPSFFGWRLSGRKGADQLELERGQQGVADTEMMKKNFHRFRFSRFGGGFVLVYCWYVRV